MQNITEPTGKQAWAAQTTQPHAASPTGARGRDPPSQVGPCTGLKGTAHRTPSSLGPWASGICVSPERLLPVETSFSKIESEIPRQTSSRSLLFYMQEAVSSQPRHLQGSVLNLTDTVGGTEVPRPWNGHSLQERCPCSLEFAHFQGSLVTGGGLPAVGSKP